MGDPQAAPPRYGTAALHGGSGQRTERPGGGRAGRDHRSVVEQRDGIVPHRQGKRLAKWTWDEGKLVVASVDGITDEFVLKGAKPAATACGGCGAGTAPDCRGVEPAHLRAAELDSLGRFRRVVAAPRAATSHSDSSRRRCSISCWASRRAGSSRVNGSSVAACAWRPDRRRGSDSRTAPWRCARCHRSSARARRNAVGSIRPPALRPEWSSRNDDVVPIATR